MRVAHPRGSAAFVLGSTREVVPAPAVATTVPSFDEIYTCHFRFVWRSVQALGIASGHAEDATQDVFIVVHRRLSEFRGESHVRTWLFAIAMRVAADHRKRVLYRLFSEMPDEDCLPDGAPGPLEVATRKQAVDFLLRALARMEESQRVVLFLMDVEELRANEVADLLSVNVNTVYSRLHRARESFNELVEQLTKPRPRAGLGWPGASLAGGGWPLPPPQVRVSGRLIVSM